MSLAAVNQQLVNMQANALAAAGATDTFATSASGAVGSIQALTQMVISLNKATVEGAADFHAMTAKMGEQGAIIDALAVKFPHLVDFVAGLNEAYKAGTIDMISYHRQMQDTIDQLTRLSMLNTGKTAADMLALARAIKAMMEAATSAPAPPPKTNWG